VTTFFKGQNPSNQQLIKEGIIAKMENLEIDTDLQTNVCINKLVDLGIDKHPALLLTIMKYLSGLIKYNQFLEKTIPLKGSTKVSLESMKLHEDIMKKCSSGWCFGFTRSKRLGGKHKHKRGKTAKRTKRTKRTKGTKGTKGTKRTKRTKKYE
jgi:hypothetical protein